MTTQRTARRTGIKLRYDFLHIKCAKSIYRCVLHYISRAVLCVLPSRLYNRQYSPTAKFEPLSCHEYCCRTRRCCHTSSTDAGPVNVLRCCGPTVIVLTALPTVSSSFSYSFFGCCRSGKAVARCATASSLTVLCENDEIPRYFTNRHLPFRYFVVLEVFFHFLFPPAPLLAVFRLYLYPRSACFGRAGLRTPSDGWPLSPIYLLHTLTLS